MSVLKGCYPSAVDGNYRSVMPSPFRTRFLNGDVTLLPRPNGCISIYDRVDFDKMVTEMLENAKNNEPEIQKVKNLTSNSFDVHFDSAGRYTVPSVLAAFAGIEPGDPVKYVGAGMTGEIWSETAYNDSEYVSAKEISFANLPTGLY